MKPPAQETPASPRASTPPALAANNSALSPTTAPAPRITLHIEELVLHGAPPGDRHGIADAVQAELHRLLAERGLPAWAQGETSVDQLAGGPCPAPFPAGANSFGTSVAGAVYEAVPGRRIKK